MHVRVQKAATQHKVEAIGKLLPLKNADQSHTIPTWVFQEHSQRYLFVRCLGLFGVGLGLFDGRFGLLDLIRSAF
jgi:hypothetical protein